MYPEQQPQQQPEPQPEQRPPYQPPVDVQTPVAPKKGIKMPIILMVWPAATLILAIFLYAIMNFAFASDGDLFGDDGPIKIILNVTLFIISAAALVAGPVSFIVGLVLLIQRKSKR
jgi:hypothetical protein